MIWCNAADVFELLWSDVMRPPLRAFMICCNAADVLASRNTFNVKNVQCFQKDCDIFVSMWQTIRNEERDTGIQCWRSKDDVTIFLECLITDSLPHFRFCVIELLATFMHFSFGNAFWIVFNNKCLIWCTACITYIYDVWRKGMRYIYLDVVSYLWQSI